MSTNDSSHPTTEDINSTKTSPAAIGFKNPTAADRLKYNLRELPDSFEATAEELALLQIYDARKSYEKNAAKLREETARAKLAKRQAEFQKKQTPSSRKRKAKKKKALDPANYNEADDDDDDDSEPEDEDDDDDDDESVDPQSAEAKLEAMRVEVEQVKERISMQDKHEVNDALRDTLLETADDITDDFGGVVRKKKKLDHPPETSLIDNLTVTATPPYDFSKRLGLSPISGRVLFPTDHSDERKWEPPEGVCSPNDGAFLVDLDDFDVTRSQSGGNNTVAIKFASPADSRRFSINIAEKIHCDDFDSVLFHFNPRKQRGGQLVINDKQEGTWGQALNIPLTQVPLMFGQESCTLMIQINEEGYDVFVEGKHCARLEHRTELPSTNTTLALQFPSTDDSGKPENWAVFKVWWGNRPLMAAEDVADVPGVNAHDAMHPRKIFVSGLPKIRSQAEVDLRKAELERAFRAYGGDRGVTVLAPTNSSYAFVEMESEQATELALLQMASRYKMNRARRSRHEVLQEKREAAARAGVTTMKSAWD